MDDQYLVRVFDGRASLHFGPLPASEARELRDNIAAANPGPSVTMRRLLLPALAVDAADNLRLMLAGADS